MARISEKRRNSRLRRHARVRRRVVGTAERPRMAVFRSSKHIYVQLIDDVSGHTLISASTREPGFDSGDGSGKTDRAVAVGKTAAERAKASGIDSVVFDRGGFKYHGRVRSLAEAAREAGLEF